MSNDTKTLVINYEEKVVIEKKTKEITLPLYLKDDFECDGKYLRIDEDYMITEIIIDGMEASVDKTHTSMLINEDPTQGYTKRCKPTEFDDALKQAFCIICGEL